MSALPARLLGEAADRLLALRAAPDDPARQSAARAWIAQHPDHGRAWALAERAWLVAGDALDLPRPANRNRLRRWATALAACLALALAAPEIHLRLAADATTPPGGGRAFSLADGSQVALAGESALAVDLGADARQVRLLRGAAYFEVAADPVRPFTVAAGAVTVTVRGTGFAVVRDDAGTTVAVAHGRVEVTTAEGTATLGGGERIEIGARGLRRTAIAPADVALWREDRLAVRDAPLGEVLEALARRHGGVYLVGAAMRARRVTGVFDLSDPERALAALFAPQRRVPERIFANVWRAAEK